MVWVLPVSGGGHVLDGEDMRIEVRQRGSCSRSVSQNLVGDMLAFVSNRGDATIIPVTTEPSRSPLARVAECGAQ